MVRGIETRSPVPAADKMTLPEPVEFLTTPRPAILPGPEVPAGRHTPERGVDPPLAERSPPIRSGVEAAFFHGQIGLPHSSKILPYEPPEDSLKIAADTPPDVPPKLPLDEARVDRSPRILPYIAELEGGPVPSPASTIVEGRIPFALSPSVAGDSGSSGGWLGSEAAPAERIPAGAPDARIAGDASVGSADPSRSDDRSEARLCKVAGLLEPWIFGEASAMVGQLLGDVSTRIRGSGDGRGEDSAIVERICEMIRCDACWTDAGSEERLTDGFRDALTEDLVAELGRSAGGARGGAFENSEPPRAAEPGAMASDRTSLAPVQLPVGDFRADDGADPLLAKLSDFEKRLSEIQGKCRFAIDEALGQRTHGHLLKNHRFRLSFSALIPKKSKQWSYPSSYNDDPVKHTMKLWGDELGRLKREIEEAADKAKGRSARPGVGDDDLRGDVIAHLHGMRSSLEELEASLAKALGICST